MELKFTPLRIVILITLLVGYALFGGFVIPPDLPDFAMRKWIWAPLLFTGGAVLSTVIDHFVGLLERTSLRWFYVVLGVAAMAAAATLQHLFTSA